MAGAAKGFDRSASCLTVKGSWKMASAGQQDRHGIGETSNTWECLNVWREIESTNCAWGCQQLVEDGLQCCWCDAHSGHKAHFRHELQGLQPYVSVNDYHEPPFPWMHDGGKFGIDLGVDHAFSILTSSRAGLSHEMMASNPGGYGHDGCGSAQKSQDTQLKGTPCAKLEGDRPAQDMASCETKDGEDPEGAEGTSSSKQMEARPFEESRSQMLTVRPGRGKISDITGVHGRRLKGHCALRSQSGQACLDLLMTGPWKLLHSLAEASVVMHPLWKTCWKMWSPQVMITLLLGIC